MRIIGGKFKGRKFFPPAKNWPTRPTTDYAKEGLFNIILNTFDIENLKVLDLFGGTGNHSYEFISRGCTDVTYVDKFYECVAFVKKTAQILDIQDYIKIVKAKAIIWQTPSKYQKQNIYHYVNTGKAIKTKSNTTWQPHTLDIGIGMNALYLQG